MLLPCDFTNERYLIVVAGKTIRFSFIIGGATEVTPIKSDNTPLHLSKEHPFWRALARWREQGSRVGADGICIWEEHP